MSNLLVRLAKAVLDTAYDLEITRGKNAYNACRHCGAEVYYDQQVSLIPHQADCIVRVIHENALPVRNDMDKDGLIIKT